MARRHCNCLFPICPFCYFNADVVAVGVAARHLSTMLDQWVSFDCKPLHRHFVAVVVVLQTLQRLLPPPLKKKKENHSRGHFPKPRPDLVPCHSVAMPRLALFPAWKRLLLRLSYNNVTVNHSYRHLLMKTEQFDVTYLMKK